MEKLGNRQTKDHIADLLRQKILSGQIADGEELAQEQLAQALAVSRMPVREALQILELEGLLLRLPNRHMRVVGLNRNNVRDSMRVIAAVELEIISLLLERGGELPEEIDCSDSDAFHSWFSAQLGNPFLAQAHRRMLSGYPRYAWSRCPGRFTEQNRRIWQAVRQGDTAVLQAAVREDYRELAEVLISGLEGSQDESKAN